LIFGIITRLKMTARESTQSLRFEPFHASAGGCDRARRGPKSFDAAGA
jgi:hypothetical protein